MEDELQQAATNEEQGANEVREFPHATVSEIIARIDADNKALRQELWAARQALIGEGARTREIENELARYKAAIPRTALELSEAVDALNAKIIAMQKQQAEGATI